MGLMDPQRTNMIAILGEVSLCKFQMTSSSSQFESLLSSQQTTGHFALRRMHQRMQQNPVGREILAFKPRVSEETLDLPSLRYFSLFFSLSRYV
jgi:ubiquinone biosynthesis protein Coq4